VSDEQVALAALQAVRPPEWGDQPRHGRFPDDATLALHLALSRVIRTAASPLIAAQTVAFISDFHLLYPRDDADAEALGRRSTTILQSLERTSPVFESLARELTSGDHIRVSFSAYVSSHDSSSLGNHRDEWDNIVVQLSGSKVFRFSNTDDVHLRQGEYLTIPQNVVHRVETPEQSTHLSVVMLRRLG
jgi:ribosomal protein L16 Arg81 hydroxylase